SCVPGRGLRFLPVWRKCMTMTIRLTRTIGFEDTNTIGYYRGRTMFCRSPSVIPAHTPGAYGTSRATHLRVSLVVYSASYFADAAHDMGCKEKYVPCGIVGEESAELTITFGRSMHSRMPR